MDGWTLILLIISLGFNLAVFLFKPIMAKGFLTGQWSGHLSDGMTCRLDCIAVFYKERGVLRGHLYYRGIDHDGKQVVGFDVLGDDSSRFVAKRATKSPLKTEFEIGMARDVHVLDGKPLSLPISKVYPYKFGVLARFSNPRMSCEVAILTDPATAAEVTLNGEFSRPNGNWSG